MLVLWQQKRKQVTGLPGINGDDTFSNMDYNFLKRILIGFLREDFMYAARRKTYCHVIINLKWWEISHWSLGIRASFSLMVVLFKMVLFRHNWLDIINLPSCNWLIFKLRGFVLAYLLGFLTFRDLGEKLMEFYCIVENRSWDLFTFD